MVIKGFALLNPFSHTRDFYLVLENPQIWVATCSLKVSFPWWRGRELSWSKDLCCASSTGYNWLRNAYAVPLFKFSLRGKKKIKKEKKKFGLTKLSHKTFKLLWHHKLKTISQILCDINMWSCWLQGKFTNLLAGESVLAYPALPTAPGPAYTAPGFIRLLALAVWQGALWAFIISKQKQNATPTFRHWTWTI